MGATGTIIIVGCGDVAELVRKAGFRVREVDYFWGTEPIDDECVGAVVASRVGGGTGLAVADRLRRRLIVPLVLYGADEKNRILGRFLGVERSEAGSRSEFHAMLELIVRETIALREIHPALTTFESKEESVDDWMILAVAPEQ